MVLGRVAHRRESTEIFWGQDRQDRCSSNRSGDKRRDRKMDLRECGDLLAYLLKYISVFSLLFFLRV